MAGRRSKCHPAGSRPRPPAWIADPGGTLKGGFFADGSINGQGCTYTTTAHAMTYQDYSTGFRCCRDPSP